MEFAPNNPFSTQLWNLKFRTFSATTGYGRDFRIVSPLFDLPLDEISFEGKEKLMEIFVGK